MLRGAVDGVDAFHHFMCALRRWSWAEGEFLRIEFCTVAHVRLAVESLCGVRHASASCADVQELTPRTLHCTSLHPHDYSKGAVLIQKESKELELNSSGCGRANEFCLTCDFYSFQDA